MSIALDIHICDQRRSYVARFDGDNAEQRALDFMDAREQTNNHVISEIEAEQLDYDLYPQLTRKLYPLCPHGMDLHNCYGPQHYYFDEEEQAHGMRNGWC